MQILGIASVPALLVTIALAGWLWNRATRLGAEKIAAEERLADVTARVSELGADRADMAGRLAEAQARLEAASAAKAGAESRQNELALQLEKAQAAAAAAEAAREGADRRRIDHERLAALAEQKLAEQEKRLVDFEQVARQMTEAAKAATLEAGKLLNGQLLENHKREAEVQKKDTEATVRKTTEAMFQQMATVTETLTRLHHDVDESRRDYQVIQRTLSSPGEAGRHNEINLENILKHFGLHPERDFFVQYDTRDDDDKRLRPDAVLFLPGDAALVIDAKSSKFIREAAAAEGTDEAEAALARLASRMNLHLAALSGKNYREAVALEYQRSGRGGNLRQTISVMFLPTEGAIERVLRADPDFSAKALKCQITLAGPRTLDGIIVLAKSQIALARQADNYEAIVKTMGLLLDSIGVLTSNLDKVGDGILKAAKGYEAVVKTVNGNLFSRTTKLLALGVKPKSQGSQPQKIPSFMTRKDEASDIIDAEAEEIAGTPLLSDKTEAP